MSPSKPARVLKVLVPKHNSDRLSAAAAAAVKEHALVEKKRFLGNGTKAFVSHVGKAASSENASEWNSLVVHARAERGPQFDVGTQLFHVDQGSNLFFDSTELYKSEELLHLGLGLGQVPGSAHPNALQHHVPPPHMRQHQHQQVTLSDAGNIQLRTPTRSREAVDAYHHHLALQNQASPRTPQPFTLSSTGGPVGPPGGGIQLQHQYPQHLQQHPQGVPPGYPGTPVGYMGGRPGPMPMPGSVPSGGGPGMNGMMNGMSPQHGMGMNGHGHGHGHAPSPSPARTPYPPVQGGVRGFPPGMYPS